MKVMDEAKRENAHNGSSCLLFAIVVAAKINLI